MIPRAGATLALLMVAALAGCGGSPSDTAMDIVLVPRGDLPAGWALVPNSEMPPSDKMPWMHENPQLLTGPDTDWVANLGGGIVSSRSWTALYAKGNSGAMIMTVTYDTEGDRERAIAAVRRQGPSPDLLYGCAQHAPNTVAFLMVAPQEPDRAFFVRRFESRVVVETQAPAGQDMDNAGGGG